MSGTFFVVGENVTRDIESIRRIVNEGHILGCHTFSHPHLTSLSDDEIKAEMKQTDQIIYETTGINISSNISFFLIIFFFKK